MAGVMETLEQFQSPFPRSPNADPPLYYVKVTDQFVEELGKKDVLSVEVDFDKRAFLITREGDAKPTLFYFDTQHMSNTGNDMVCAEGPRNGKSVRGCGQINQKLAIRPLGRRPPAYTPPAVVEAEKPSVTPAAISAKFHKHNDSDRIKARTPAGKSSDRGREKDRLAKSKDKEAGKGRDDAHPPPVVNIEELVVKILAKGPLVMRTLLKQLQTEKRKSPGITTPLTPDELDRAKAHCSKVAGKDGAGEEYSLKPTSFALVNLLWYNDDKDANENLKLVKEHTRSQIAQSKLTDVQVAKKFGFTEADVAQLTRNYVPANGQSTKSSTDMTTPASGKRESRKRMRNEIEDEYQKIYEKFHAIYPKYRNQYSTMKEIQEKFSSLSRKLKTVDRNDSEYESIKRKIGEEYKKSKEVIKTCKTQYAEFGDGLKRLKREAAQLQSEYQLH